MAFERDQPEHARREELYRLLTENTDDFIRLHDMNRQTIYASQSFERRCGRSPRTLFEFAHPDDLEACRSWWGRILAGGTDRLHWRMRLADGTWRWLETSGVQVRYHERPAILTVCRNITEGKRIEESLRAQEAKYRLLVEQLPVVTYTAAMDEIGGTLFVSPQIEAILGDPAEVWMNDPHLWSSRIHPDDRERVLTVWNDACRTDEPLRVEYRMLARDGSERWFLDEARIVRDAHGKPLVMQGVMLDISQQKHVQEQLRERTAAAALTVEIARALSHYEALPGMLHDCVDALARHLDAALVRIWTLGVAENVLELQASAGLCTDLDGPHSRVPVGRGKIGLIAQERRPHLAQDVMKDPGFKDLDWARKQGIASFAGYPLLTGSRLVGVMAIFSRHPLSETVLDSIGAVANQIAAAISRKHAEEELRRNEELLRRAEGMAHIAGWTFTVDDGMVLTSAEGRRLFGWAPGPHPIGDLLAIIHPDDRPRVEAAMEKALTGVPFEMHHRLVVGGEVKWVQRRVEPESDETGRVVRLTGVSQDVTARRHLEEQFRQAQKMEAIGHLAGGVAHDFNNLLTIISGYSEILLDGLPREDPKREMISQIREAGERAGVLTRQLLAFSRQTVLEPKVLDLNELVLENEKMLRRLIGEDVQLDAELDPAIGSVKVDPGQLVQVIMNLAVNARDAMPTGGKLTIETANATLDEALVAATPEAKLGRYVLLAVTDSGSGMTPEVRARIFEPFFTTKGPGKGTGLGLATVYGIVKQSGGFISVHTEPGRGTAFKIYFPMVEGRAAKGKESTETKPLARGTETILLVEDEDAVRSMVRTMLEQTGYKVLEASRGSEALRLADEHREPIHLLITDVVMPEMSGRELVERLVRQRSKIKVLYLSGYTDDAVVRHGVLQAEVAFLQKPFTIAALTKTVRKVLSASPH